jgi:hypothetical protein
MLKLLGDALASPVTGPVHGLEFILNAIKDQVEGELFDESKLQGQLMDLSLKAQMGEISGEEYQAQEDAIMARLNEIRAYKQALAEEEAGYVDAGPAVESAEVNAGASAEANAETKAAVSAQAPAGQQAGASTEATAAPTTSARAEMNAEANAEATA